VTSSAGGTFTGGSDGGGSADSVGGCGVAAPEGAETVEVAPEEFPGVVGVRLGPAGAVGLLAAPDCGCGPRVGCACARDAPRTGRPLFGASTRVAVCRRSRSRPSGAPCARATLGVSWLRTSVGRPKGAGATPTATINAYTTVAASAAEIQSLASSPTDASG